MFLPPKHHGLRGPSQQVMAVVVDSVWTMGHTVDVVLDNTLPCAVGAVCSTRHRDAVGEKVKGYECRRFCTVCQYGRCPAV